LATESASVEEDLKSVATRCGPRQPLTRCLPSGIDAKDHEFVGCHALYTNNKTAAVVGYRGRQVRIVRDRGSSDWIHRPANIVDARVHASLNRFKTVLGGAARGTEDRQNQYCV
jgi:hypothetical protein